MTSKLQQFLRQYNNEFFEIRAKNNTKLYEYMEIGLFFEQLYYNELLPNFKGYIPFEQFYQHITYDFQEMKNGHWYAYNDWSENSKKNFKSVCQGFYKAIF